MPAVRFEAKAFTDIRFAMLAKELDWHVHRVRGAMLEIWAHCTENNVDSVKAKALDILADAEGFSAALVECELAQEISPGVLRVRGARERISWLATKRSQLAQARDNRWKGSDDSIDVNADDSSVLKQTSEVAPGLSSVCTQSGPLIDDNPDDWSVDKQTRITVTRAVTRAVTKEASKKADALERVEWPLGLRTPETEEALRSWVDYRRESKKPITARTCNAILGAYVGRPEDFARDVRHSIAQGYQGLYAPNGGRSYRSGEMDPNNLSADDIRRIGEAAEARGQ